MRVTIKEDKAKQGFYTVTPSGPIDSESHGGFRDQIGPLMAPSTKNILINLKDVDYISSAGFGVFFALKKYLAENSASLTFCHLRPQIKKLFKAMKALPKESIFESIEEADKYFYQIMNDEIKKQKNIKD